MKISGRTLCFLTAAAMAASSLPAAVFAEENDDPVLTVRDIIFTDGGMDYRIGGAEDNAVRSDGPAVFSARRSAALPERFDPRENGTVTAVRDQSTASICWAFASLSCAEQNLILKGYENASVDLSEASLAYASAFDGGASDSPFESGGNWMNAAVALANGKGLCYEDYEPFIPGDHDGMVISDYKTQVCEYQLGCAQVIDGSISSVKKKILGYGAVMVNYFTDDKYLTADGKSYFDPETSEDSFVNHGVSVIGWDDNYSRENFLDGAQPQSDGAWLVKGSWGAFNRDGGYYWISYEEAELDSWCVFDMEECSDNVYYHAENTDSMVCLNVDDELYAANVFTAESDEYLSRIGFLSVGDSQARDYTVTVYTGVSDGSPIGAEAISADAAVSGDGFYTVDLPEAVRLERGEKFSVVLCAENSDNRGVIIAENSNVTRALPGESYYSVGGTSWTDVTDGLSVCGSVYINAYTEEASAADKEELEGLVGKYGDTAGLEKETDNAVRVLKDKSADKTDVENAELLIKAAAEEKDEYLVISSEEQWKDFARRVCGGEDFSGKTVTLESDLDFGGESVSPVGTDANYFKGYFDGNGHVIKNAVFEGNVYGGVFSAADGCARIKNLTAVNCSVTASYAGGIVGYLDCTDISSCGFSGIVSGSKSAGGIAGNIGSTSVTECFSDLSAESSENAKAFFGTSYNSQTVPDITYCFSNMLFEDDLYANGSLPDFDKSAAYDLNTFRGAQTDSGKWTMENGFAKQTRPDEEPSHKITFEAMGQELYGYSDKNGNVKFPVINLQSGYSTAWYGGGQPVDENTAFTEDTAVTAVFSYMRTLSDCELSGFSRQIVYNANGAEQSGLKLSFGGEQLEEDVDYSLAYRGNDKPGTAYVTIIGQGAYSGEIELEYEVVPKDCSSLAFSYGSVYAFTGKAITPSVTVRDGAEILVKGRDYSVSYQSNVKVGTGKIIIAFKGNYKGTAAKSFAINPARQEIQTLETRYKGFYIDYVQKGSATGYEINYSLSSGFSGAVTKRVTNNMTDKLTVSGLSAGKKYYVRVRSYTVNGGKTYYGAWSPVKTAVTAKYDLASAKITGITSKTYTGKAVTQSIQVKYGSKTLKNGTDYTVKYSSNVKVGTAKLTITGKGSYGGVITKSFKINPAKQTIQKLSSKKGGFYIDYAQKGSATGYEISYARSSSFSGAGKVKVTNNRTDKKNVTGLKRYTKYYVRVRSYTVVNGKTYCGAWSPVKTVTTG